MLTHFLILTLTRCDFINAYSLNRTFTVKKARKSEARVKLIRAEVQADKKKHLIIYIGTNFCNNRRFVELHLEDIMFIQLDSSGYGQGNTHNIIIYITKV